MMLATEAGRRDIARVEIRENEGCKGVFAKEDLEVNSVLTLEGVVSDRQTRYSIQLEHNRHLSLPPDADGQTDHPGFFWTYLNHSCQPNGYIDTSDFTFRTLRKIKRGEECTFNYLTTEDEMAVPFVCQCGAAKCFGLIQGYKHLSAEQRKELVSLSAVHPTSSGG